GVPAVARQVPARRIVRRELGQVEIRDEQVRVTAEIRCGPVGADEVRLSEVRLLPWRLHAVAVAAADEYPVARGVDGELESPHALALAPEGDRRAEHELGPL